MLSSFGVTLVEEKRKVVSKHVDWGIYTEWKGHEREESSLTSYLFLH